VHRSRQITTPTPHHSVFYRPDGLPVAQPTASKHWSLSGNPKYFPKCQIPYIAFSVGWAAARASAWVAGMVICLEQDADLHMAQMPLTVCCFSKIQIGFNFLLQAHLGSPGKRAVKRVCACVCQIPYIMFPYNITPKQWHNFKWYCAAVSSAFSNTVHKNFNQEEKLSANWIILRTENAGRHCQVRKVKRCLGYIMSMTACFNKAVIDRWLRPGVATWEVTSSAQKVVPCVRWPATGITAHSFSQAQGCVCTALQTCSDVEQPWLMSKYDVIHT